MFRLASGSPTRKHSCARRRGTPRSVAFHLSLALAPLAVGPAEHAPAPPLSVALARGQRTLPSGISAGVRRARPRSGQETLFVATRSVATSKSRRRRQILPEGDGRGAERI